MTDDGREADAGTGRLQLLVTSPETFFSYPLPCPGSVTVGRSATCDVRLDDPRTSREHVRIHLQLRNAQTTIDIEDLASRNRTRIRNVPIEQGKRVGVSPGEVIALGSTVLIVLEDHLIGGSRRAWAHSHFENQVDRECVRAVSSGSRFALARVRLPRGVAWTKVLPLLAEEIPPPHVFAAYGPSDYEVLLLEASEGEVGRILRRVSARCRIAGFEAKSVVAWFPTDGRSLDTLVAHVNELVNPVRQSGPQVGPIATVGAAMKQIHELAARAAGSAINVLIRGESGVGKDVLARTLHRLSPRADGPFVALNCAAITESLVESELFGYARGAFTGATTPKIGLIESAQGGTVFLDEIGDMPPAMQAKLLRVIEAREIQPIGSLRPKPIDVRFISATHQDLEAAVSRGAFRSDLMFRLDGLTLKIPPLRERLDEIPALATTFTIEAARAAGRHPPTIGADALRHLVGRAWSGNIRELKNVLERALVLCDGPEIRPEHLSLDSACLISDGCADLGVSKPLSRLADTNLLPRLDDPKKIAERDRILNALILCSWNQTKAAALLEMPRRTFVAKLRRYGVPRPQKGSFPSNGQP